MKKVILIFVTIVLSGLLYAKDNKSTDALLREIDGIIKNRGEPFLCKCPFHKYSKFLDKDYCTNFKLK